MRTKIMMEKQNLSSWSVHENKNPDGEAELVLMERS